MTHAAHHAFVTGFNTIALVSVAVAALGAVAAYALVRPRDFVGAGHPTQALSEPAPAHHDLVVPDRITPPIPDTLSNQDALPLRAGATANAGLDPSGATHPLVAKNRDPSLAGGLRAAGPILTPQPTDFTKGWKG